MSEKFGRNYSLLVETTTGETITITLPFTVEFNIVRNTFSSANSASIRILNLSEKNRNKIRKDVSDYGDIRSLQFNAGYGVNLPIAFAGDITQAWSVREGVNFITQIECFDGGSAFATGQTNEQFPAGTPQATVIKTLAQSLPGVSLGAIGKYEGVLGRGNSYNGPTLSILRELTGGGVFIDNGQVNCLGNNECLVGEIEVISPASGLLGTPVREAQILHFEMLFEPRIIVGQKVRLQSSTDVSFNGDYKVVSVEHHGVISEAVCGDAVTTVGLFYGGSALSDVAS